MLAFGVIYIYGFYDTNSLFHAEIMRLVYAP